MPPRSAARLERILELAVRGLSNAAIAAELEVSEATISRALSTSEGRALGQGAQLASLADWASLTDAERAVARLALEGHTNVAIAGQRGSSPRTVANQLASAYQKLGVSSRRQLLAAVLRAARKN